MSGGTPSYPGHDPDQPKETGEQGQQPQYPQQPQQPHQQPPAYGQQYGQPGQPGQYGGYGQPGQYGQYGQQPGQYGGGYGAPSPYAANPHKRPAQVTTAIIMTWVGSALALLLGVACLALYSNQNFIDTFVAEMGDTQSFSSDEIAGFILATGVVLSLWSIAVLVVSVFAWRRANWARLVLTVMGGIYIVVQLAALVTGGLAVIIGIGWVVGVIVLLWLSPSSQWYAGRNIPAEPYGYGQPNQPSQPNRPW